MPTIQLPLVGPFYTHRSLPLAAQSTINWYPEINQEAESEIVLAPTPGLKLWSSGELGGDRGLYQFGGVLYKVTADRLKSIDSEGVQTDLGLIEGGDRVSFIDDGTNLVIVAGGTVNLWDGATITQVSTNFESPNFVAFLNQQGIYDGLGDRFVVSDAGSVTTLTPANFAEAESHSDNLLRPYVFQDTLYLYGELTIEPWFNSGVGSPPFAGIEGSVSTVGLGANHSIGSNENFMYFLGHNRSVYRLVGSNLTPISTIPLTNAIRSFSQVDDAIGWCFRFQDQNFYFLTFPTAKKTFVYSEAVNAWFQMATGVDGGVHAATSYIFAYDKHLLSVGPDIFEWDTNTFTDDGETIRRVRTTAVIDGSLLGPEVTGYDIEMTRLELIMQKGTGLETGQGTDPQIMLRYSDDGGRTWTPAGWTCAGALGAFEVRVEWHRLGSFRNRILEFAVTDPVDWSLFRLGADLEVGI